MELEERLLGLERTLSTLSGHEGWVIGKCRFELGTVEKKSVHDIADYPYQLEILRENRNLAEIQIRGGYVGDYLLVTLMKPIENGGRRIREKDLAQTGNFLVTREETDRYLVATGDKNPIHQGENAIVPGFLMVNKIAEMFENPEKLRVRFFTPLAVGESVELVIRKKDGSGQDAEVYRNGERILKMEENTNEHNSKDSRRQTDHMDHIGNHPDGAHDSADHGVHLH